MGKEAAILRTKGNFPTSRIDYRHSALQGADQEYLINTPRNRVPLGVGSTAVTPREGESPDEPLVAIRTYVSPHPPTFLNNKTVP